MPPICRSLVITRDYFFTFMESLDEDGMMDFGDFVRAVCTYCLFGKSELMAFAYTVQDPDGRGETNLTLTIPLTLTYRTTTAPWLQSEVEIEVALWRTLFTVQRWE
jgi:hypothetical protein